MLLGPPRCPRWRCDSSPRHALRGPRTFQTWTPTLHTRSPRCVQTQRAAVCRWGWIPHGTASHRPGIYVLYQTVVLRLPYITSERRPWSQDQAPANILVPPLYLYVRVCVYVYPTPLPLSFLETTLHFARDESANGTEKRNLSPPSLSPSPGFKRRRAARGEEDSKRSHRPRRVVAGIPAADFICRMSTSRGHVRTEPRGAGGGGRMRGTRA